MAVAAIKVSEDSYAEQPALEWLNELGWEYHHGSEYAPSENGERTHYSDVVLRHRLAAALRQLNPDIPAEELQRAGELVLTTTSPEVIRDHGDFHELLLQGVPVSYLDAEGIERSGRARLVDWDNPENNEFLMVNQLTIVVGKKNRRPDILLFVNGLPLGQVELKNPADESATPESAVNQILHYKDTIPKLYRFTEIIGVSDLLQARVGTISTPAEHFAEWKTLDTEADEERSPLEVMLRSVFAPTELLDLIRNFTLFETDGPRTWKVLAKYHQVHAVDRAIEETARAMGGDGKAGVVWHTQGVGKSYTMAFYATKARRDERFANPTIIGLTDRNDLDEQLYKTFARQKHLRPVQADRIRGDDHGLYELLDRPAGGIIFTTIQKFQPPSDSSQGLAEHERPEMPVLSDRSNVIIMADEAHRSQYKDLAENLTLALPNAVRIGFTGTPLERADKSTRNVFGGYISIYRMAQAQEDGMTVPIYYESRQVKVDADPEELRKVEAVLETEEEDAQSKLVTRWAKLEKVVGADDRLDKVADDIAEHYIGRVTTLEGKAMVVGYSRRICAELTERLRVRLGKDAVTCVMTAQATEDPALSQFRRSKQEMRDVEAEFKDTDSPLKIVVVRDMWLTGFDVPSLHTLYIDKPMRDHGLLQAIARVNRVFEDKPGGLVVDYIGIGEDLRASLTAYSDNDIDDVAIPLREAIMRMREKHEVLCGLLEGIRWHPSEGMSAGDRATLFVTSNKKSLDLLLASEEQTQQFLDEQLAFCKWMALVGPEPDAIKLRGDAGFFAGVAKQLRQLAPKSGEASGAAEQAVKQFFAEGLGAGEIVDVFALAGQDRPEISVLSDEFLDSISDGDDENLQVALLRKLINDQVKARQRSNSMEAKRFSEQMEKVLGRYANKQLTSADVVQALVELAKRIRDARQRHEDLGLNEEESAFYDALAGDSEDWKADPELKTIAAALVKNIKDDLSVDWSDRASSEAAIRSKIKRLLRRHGYQPPPTVKATGGKASALDEVAQLVLDQARVLYRTWPDVETGDALFVETVVGR